MGARARAGEQRYRDYFHVYPDRTMPDAYERTLPEVFPDFAPGNFTWDDEVEGWVWTTFNEWQWDLDWSNPDVLVEYADIVLYLANLGVEVLRLDAIAFIVEAARARTARTSPRCTRSPRRCGPSPGSPAPALVFKAEAIVGPRDLVRYLGRACTTARSATSPTTTA